jgi:hypothetical protein
MITGRYGATLPDEMEYAASSAVGYSVSPQVEKGGEGNARKMEGFSRMLPWSWLTNRGNVSAALRARLRQPEMDYELRRSGNSSTSLVAPLEATETTVEQYWITPVKYHGNEGVAAKVVNSALPSSTKFDITAAFAAQGTRWGCRVRCLPALAPPGDPRNIKIFTASTTPTVATANSSALSIDARYGSHTSPPGFNASLVITVETTASGSQSESQSQSRSRSRSRGSPTTDATMEWARASVSFSPALDLSDRAVGDTTAERALGAWINADGCGATLNLQLSSGVGCAMPIVLACASGIVIVSELFESNLRLSLILFASVTVQYTSSWHVTQPRIA